MKTKTLHAFLLTGAILGTNMMTGLVPAIANDATDTQIEMGVAADEDYAKDFAEYINGLQELTAVEKDSLIQTENQLAPTWDKIQALEDEVDVIFDKVVGDQLQNEYEAIFNENEALWDKFYNGVAEDADLSDLAKAIDQVDFLTAEEKTVLKSAQEKMAVLDKEMEALNAQADAQAQPLYDQLDKLYVIVDKAYAKNDSIWNKVFKDDTAVLYHN